jgi:predicted transcriptional regulator
MEAGSFSFYRTRVPTNQGLVTSSALLAEAFDRMVDEHEWFLAEVKNGLAQAGQGKTCES